MELFDVMQGSARVKGDNGEFLGSVERRYGLVRSGWYAYSKDGKQISEYPSPKRDMAVREVLAAAKG